MDSLTQAALGAAVGFAGWQAQLGRRAIVAGAVLGTLPDLDVLAFPVLDAVERVYWHRGVSHGIVPLLFASGLIGLLLQRWYPARPLGWGRASSVTFLILGTHVAIDFFTVYGTQIFAPFSRHGYGSNNLFIIDPLYTFPLLIGLGGALLARVLGTRRRLNLAGLIVSTLYVGWSFVAQARADNVFARELARQGWSAGPSQTSPTAFNTLLWRHLAAVEGGFLIGYWSWLDSGETVRFQFVPQAAERVSSLEGSRALEAVRWFSQGFWVARESARGVVVSDLRFGEIRAAPGAPPEAWEYIFSWRLGQPTEDGSGLDPLPAGSARRGESLRHLWRRLRGDRDAW